MEIAIKPLLRKPYHFLRNTISNHEYFFKSLYYSFRYFRLSRIPIACHNHSKFKANKSATVIIKHRLTVGAKYTLLCKQPAHVEVKNNATLNIDGKVDLGKGTVLIVHDNAKCYIGNNTYIAGDTKIYAINEIRIGENCALSWGLTIIDSDFHTMLPERKKKVKPISIGNHVWIASNVTVLKGVTIGDNCVIAANSVVTKDIPPNSLAAGSPAKVIKTNIDWEL